MNDVLVLPRLTKAACWAMYRLFVTDGPTENTHDNLLLLYRRAFSIPSITNRSRSSPKRFFACRATEYLVHKDNASSFAKIRT